MRFPNRFKAGEVLAEKLIAYQNHPQTLILGLPRGGIPVAFALAQRLHLPMDAFLVRKLGVPTYPELAMGAIALNNICFINQVLVNQLNISDEQIQQVITKERTELKRRNHLYRQDKPFPDLHHSTIIVVDDGIATGASMQVAIKALKAAGVARLIIAVPVCPQDTVQLLGNEVDEMICLLMPATFRCVGEWYEDFSQTLDEEVIDLLSLPFK